MPRSKRSIALLAPPQHQLDEQIVHDVVHQPVAVAHQVDRQLASVRRGPQIGERHDLRPLAHQRHREPPQVGRVEAAEREALLAGALAARASRRRSPCSSGSSGSTRSGRHDLERRPVALRPALRLAQAGARRAVEVEAGQRHVGLLAQLVEGEARARPGRASHRARSRRTPAGRPSHRSARGTARAARAAPPATPTGSPMAIQLRPCTAYMMKLRPLSLNRNRLSPSVASQALEPTALRPWPGPRAPSRSPSGSPPGACGRGRAKRISCRPASSTMPTTTPIVARRKRGASPSSTNCHHSSLA